MRSANEMTDDVATPVFRWGLVGPGRIAHRFAAAVDRLPDAGLVAVAGRTRANAERFAAQWSARQRRIEVERDFAALAARPDVDGIYVATPHAIHAEVAAACLERGKAVLCEKPLATSAAEVAMLVAASRSRGAFLMEALWTRFLPLYRELELRLSGAGLGRVRHVQAVLGYREAYDASSRLYDPSQGGGAVLDFGVYALAALQWALRMQPGPTPRLVALVAHGAFAPTGVDERAAVHLAFEGGVAAHLFVAFDTSARNGLVVQFEHGSIEVPDDFWQATRALLRRDGESVATIDAAFEINGFEGQIREAMRCARADLFESPRMTHADSFELARWMDESRARLRDLDPGAMAGLPC